MNPKKMNKQQLIDEVTTLRARVDDLLQQSREADELNEEKASAIDNLKRVIEENQESIRCKDEELEKAKETIEQYKADNVSKTEEIQRLRTKVTEITENALNMEQTINEQVISISKAKAWKYVAVIAIIAFLLALCVIIG